MKNWKQFKFMAIVTIIVLAFVFTACDNGGGGGSTPRTPDISGNPSTQDNPWTPSNPSKPDNPGTTPGIDTPVTPDPIVPITFTVTYNGNGSTGGAVPATATHNGGATVTVLGNTGDLVKTDYTFAGWNTAPGGTGSAYTVGNTFIISADTTLYAQWLADAYGITLSIDGVDVTTSTYVFSGAQHGYGAQTAKTVTVRNTGNVPTGTLTISPNNSGSFTLSSSSMESIDAGQTGSFTVVPKTGLAAVGHSETFMVTGNGGITASFSVSFNVTPLPITTAAITNVTAPVRGAVPSTVATVSGNYTAGNVTWSPSHNPFQGNTQYDARVTLIVNANYTFTGLTGAIINGQTAVVSNNLGTQVTLSYQFPATSHWYLDNPSGPNFTITTAEELAELAQIVNGTHGTIVRDNFSGKTVALANDIDLSAYGSEFNNGNGWIPIGIMTGPSITENNSFSGTFDGNGNKITGLYINSNSYQGLFGYVRGDGTVRNLGVEDVNITGTGMVGTIVVINYQGTVTNCYATGTVSGSTGNTGGVVGSNGGGGNSTVANCYSTVVINVNVGIGGALYCGVGGIVGFNGDASTVSNCYSTGNVSVSGNELYNSFGGIAGRNGSNSGGKIINCYSTGNISGSSSGGITGDNINYGIVQNCIALNLSVKSNYTKGRVVGGHGDGITYVDYDYLINNYARNNMTTAGGNAFPSGSGTSHVNGANISSTQWNSASWWTGTAGFSTNDWNISNNSLPTLKNMPAGTQNPVIKN